MSNKNNKEILSTDELDRLKQHCQCDFHIKSWVNPIKYLMCPCCMGCLHTGQLNSDVIKRTRNYMEHNEQAKKLWSNFFENELILDINKFYE